MFAQTLEYLVRLLDMLLLIGFIEFEIDMIEIEIIGVNLLKSHQILRFDEILQVAHGTISININRERIRFTPK